MKKTVIVVLMLVLLLSGCSGNGTEAVKDIEKETNHVTTEETATTEPAETQTDGEATQEAEAELRTIIDNSGRTVENVPAAQDINRVAVMSPPLLSMYYAMVGDLNKVVAATSSAIDNGKNGVFFDMAPELANVDTECLASSEVNAEEFLNLKPDVGLFYADHQGTVFNEVDVPGIQFMIDQIYDPFLTIKAWASLMCEVMGTESEGEEIIAYGDRVLADVREKASTINEGEKLKGMFIHSYANGKISVGGSEFYADFWLTESGLINVAGETARPHQVDMEQIYKWDPDIIFIWNGPNAQDIIDNNVEGHDWSQISAVKNAKVYKIPCGVFAWYPVGSDVPLMMEWVAQQAYPDVFGYDLRTDTFDYYQKIYDYELTDEQLTKILDTK